MQNIVCFVCVPQLTQRRLVKVVLSGWGYFWKKRQRVYHNLLNRNYLFF